RHHHRTGRAQRAHGPAPVLHRFRARAPHLPRHAAEPPRPRQRPPPRGPQPVRRTGRRAHRGPPGHQPGRGVPGRGTDAVGYARRPHTASSDRDPPRPHRGHRARPVPPVRDPTAPHPRRPPAPRRRPRLAAIDIPLVLIEATGPGRSHPSVTRPLPTPAADRIDAAAEALAACRRPLIIAGAGAPGAGQEIEALAAALGAGIILSSNAKGVIDDDGEHSLGAIGFLELLPELTADADAVIAV